MKSLFLGAAVVLLSGVSAMAGPIGSGLSLTEDVARRSAAQRTITVVQADPACARQAASLIHVRDGVAWAKARGEGVQIVFQSNAHASRQEAEVRAVVAETCRAA
jgi:hypothetical protein